MDIIKNFIIVIAIIITKPFYWLPPIMIATTVAAQPIREREILLIGILIELLIGAVCIIHARNITKER